MSQANIHRQVVKKSAGNFEKKESPKNDGKEAVAISNGQILIFDLDDTSNQGIPFVLYANPERNITALIRDQYKTQIEAGKNASEQ